MADKTSKFFRVAVEGGTSDGRTIDRAWIEQMAATYNPATYGARVNCEHLRGFAPSAPFFSYGDVLALKTEEIDLQVGGKAERRLALLAQIKPNDELLKINRLGQKIYTSVEINPKFGGSDKAYLVGLAVTDSPASLGTEVLQFAAANPAASPFAARKLDPANLFTAAIETSIDIEGGNAVDADPTGIFGTLRSILAPFAARQAEPVTPPVTPPAPVPANDNAEFSKLLLAMGALPGTLEAMATAQNAAIAAVRADLTALTTKLAATEDPAGKRPPAAGGASFAVTDC